MSRLVRNVVDLELPTVGKLMLLTRGPLQDKWSGKLLRSNDELAARTENLAARRNEGLGGGGSGSRATDPRIAEVDGSGSRRVRGQSGEGRILRCLSRSEEI